MFTTIFLAVLLIAALVLFIVGFKSKASAKARAEEFNVAQDNAYAQSQDGGRGGYGRISPPEPVYPEAFGNGKYGYLPAWVGFVPLAIFVIVAAFACTAIVDAKTEGVLLTFKAPSKRLLDSGLAVKAPWQSVVEIDGTRKTDNFNNGKPNDEDDPVQDHGTIECRLGDNGKAEVYASIDWSRADGTSNRVYEQFRDDDPAEKMREALVVPRFRDAINQTCAAYQPTAAIDNLDVDFTDPQAVAAALPNAKLAPDFAALSAQAEKYMNDLLKPKDGGKPLVTVENISISGMNFPKSTETRIQEFIDEASKTRTALQSQATATAQAKANEIISESVSNDPLVLTSRCFDGLAEGLFTLPAGGSCFANSGSSVVIPSAK